MFDYLQKFNSLPADLRAKVSSDDAMTYLSALENRYQVDLAMVVMKVMIKSLAISDLESTFISEFGLSGEKAKNLSEELKEKIFSSVADYVGLKTTHSPLNLEEDIDSVIKEAGITITSSDLIARLKTVLSTYIKGVRRKIDTRQMLARDVASGGLGLLAEEIDRLFKVCDRRNYQASISHKGESTKDNIIAKNNLNERAKDKVDTSALFGITPEYDLKRALQSGETKKIDAPVSIKEEKQDYHEKVDVDDLERQLEAQISGEEKEEPLNLSKSQEKQIVEDKQDKSGADDFVIKKPEESNLFKKLFFESQKKASPGSLKFAQQINVGPSPTTQSSNQAKPDTAKLGAKAPNLSMSPSPSIQRPKAQASGVALKERSGDLRRKRLEDVKVVPKVMGPLEELEYLDVLNFRRLGNTPLERTSKIFNKVKLLEKNGYGVMIDAITAWKKSPVNRLYLHNIQEAMAKGKTVKDLVINNTEEGDNLTLEEIEAIISLNSRLTF